MTPVTMIDTIKKTIFPTKDKNGAEIVVSDAQLMMFLQVCHEYKLNPFIKEIYAFPSKGGGIVPMVPVDGWANIINRHPQYDGVEFVDDWYVDPTTQKRSLVSTTCVIYRKDRSHPTRITEYMQECYQPSKDPWVKWPARMLRHKALIQCARIAFSLSGIYDPDEAERIAESDEPVKAVITRPSRTIESVPVETAAMVATTETAAQPGTNGKKCICNCCKNDNCDCATRGESARCGCTPCRDTVTAVFAKPSDVAPVASVVHVAEEVPVAEKSEPKSESISPTDVFSKSTKPKPLGPYIGDQKRKKLIMVSKAAGVEIVKDRHDDALHNMLLEVYGIESITEIPDRLFDEILKRSGGDKLAVK